MSSIQKAMHLFSKMSLKCFIPLKSTLNLFLFPGTAAQPVQKDAELNAFIWIKRFLQKLTVGFFLLLFLDHFYTRGTDISLKGSSSWPWHFVSFGYDQTVCLSKLKGFAEFSVCMLVT